MDGWGEQDIFKQGPVVIFRWRNEPGWPVEAVSPNVVDVLGYAAAQFLTGALSYGEVVAPEDIGRIADEVRTATAAGLPSFEHEPYRIRHRDGAWRWFHDFTHVIRNDAGEATHYVGYIFDITRRIVAEAEARELERQLLMAQKLESLGVLAGGVAHDFNNLLTGMLGQLTLARRLAPADVPRLDAYLAQAERLALHAADLTNQLLAYSGKGSFVVEPTDVNALMSEMSQMLGLVVPRRATVAQDIARPLPLVMADRVQLQQVMINLLTNAAEALGDEAGHISVRTSARELSAPELAAMHHAADVRPGPYVIVEVTDTGCGMDAETQKRLFEPFFTTKFAGRGLGMAAVLGIVRAHHGAISVRSSPGVGTTFTTCLPALAGGLGRLSDDEVVAAAPSALAAKAEPTAPARHAAAHLPRHHQTILVVDDDHLLRRTAAELLAHMGFATLQAAGGAEALATYDQHAPAIALVILDLTMPVMAGEEVLAALRRRAPSLPVILSSGYSQQEAIRRTGDRLTDAGPLLFLKKPYRLAEFEALILRALAST